MVAAGVGSFYMVPPVLLPPVIDAHQQALNSFISMLPNQAVRPALSRS
jgi:hypothetical protein